MGNGSALEVVLHDDALYKITNPRLYFTVNNMAAVDVNAGCGKIIPVTHYFQLNFSTS